MTCFAPVDGFRRRGGGFTTSRTEGWTDLPVSVSCGQCHGCRVERARQWALRCVHEAKFHDQNCFITLTYSPECLPANLSVDVRHWQLFAKRLRKKKGPFRFLHCGEYGEENKRPHYHALLFGIDFKKDQVELEGRKYPTFTSDELVSVWKNGFCSIGDLTYQSAQYVARYVMKKATGPLAEKEYERVHPLTGECWQVKPPYITMSRRPGIGSKWIDKFKSDVFPDDFVVHDGRKFRPPTFYDKRLSEEELLSVKRKRRDAANKHKWNNSSDRLRVRERVAIKQSKHITRNI